MMTNGTKQQPSAVCVISLFLSKIICMTFCEIHYTEIFIILYKGSLFPMLSFCAIKKNRFCIHMPACPC